MPLDQVENKSAVRYFNRFLANGAPNFGSAPDANPDNGELFDQACLGELSVVWNRNLQNWIMTYNCDAPGGAQVLARASRLPWGPWSAPAVLLDPVQDAGFCRFLQGPGDCGPPSDKNTPNGAGGGIYAPYPIQPYTRGGAQRTTMYYVMSTWNPYDVQLMKVTLAAPNRLPFGPDTCRVGFVWREAIQDDHVCVTPRARLATHQQNAEADARRAPKGVFGLDTCLRAFVWRGAYDQDHVCVTPSLEKGPRPLPATPRRIRDEQQPFDPLDLIGRFVVENTVCAKLQYSAPEQVSAIRSRRGRV